MAIGGENGGLGTYMKVENVKDVVSHKTENRSL